MDWIYRLALKTAEQSSHDRHKMGAVVMKGGSVLSKAYNTKSNPSGSSKVGRHAEERALLPHQDFKGGSICVARSNGRISKPCDECMKSIKAAGICKIIYVDKLGNLTCEKL